MTSHQPAVVIGQRSADSALIGGGSVGHGKLLETIFESCYLGLDVCCVGGHLESVVETLYRESVRVDVMSFLHYVIR